MCKFKSYKMYTSLFIIMSKYFFPRQIINCLTFDFLCERNSSKIGIFRYKLKRIFFFFTFFFWSVTGFSTDLVDLLCVLRMTNERLKCVFESVVETMSRRDKK